MATSGDTGNQASPFNQQAALYDAWYDTPRGAAIFREERDALEPLAAGRSRPWLEIGTGSGRFAAALGIEVGIDPAIPALALARQRGIAVAAAHGEALPFPSGAFGAVFIIVTLCFVRDQAAVLREAARVTGSDGAVIVGTIPAQSSWGLRYRARAAAGDPFYRHAHFLEPAELDDLLRRAGLTPVRWHSALRWPPTGEPPDHSEPTEGIDPDAGFLAVLAVKTPHSGDDAPGHDPT